MWDVRPRERRGQARAPVATQDHISPDEARAQIVHDLAAIEAAPRTLLSHGTVQRVLVDVGYNGGQGHLRMDTSVLATKDIDWFRSFPPDAFDAILNALPQGGGDPDVATIQQRIATARQLNRNVRIEVGANDVTAYLREGGEDVQAGSASFEDTHDDGNMWLTHIDVEEQYRRRRIGLTILEAAVRHYGAVYASAASKAEHEDFDDDDTRWLEPDGQALVNSALQLGILKPEWYVNPFQGGGSGSDDDNSDY